MSALRRFWRVAPRVTTLRAVSVARATPAATQWRCYGSKGPQETDEEFDTRWVNYFNQEDIDSWDLRRGFNELYGHDLVPDPKIVRAMLQAARRLDDVAMSIRILEGVREKTAGNSEVYSFVMDAVKPTLEELGIKTPEELGIA